MRTVESNLLCVLHWALEGFAGMENKLRWVH